MVMSMLARGSSGLNIEDTCSEMMLFKSRQEEEHRPCAMNASRMAAWGTLSNALTASRKQMNRGVLRAIAACRLVMILNSADIVF
jgi:hypothetical protein